MAALDWLGTIADWLLSLVPRLRHIRSTHAGVRFTRGKATQLKAGLHVYWPVWSGIVEVCVVRQTLDLRYQSLITKDGVGVVVAVTVVYEIDSPINAVTMTDNIVDTIGDLAQRAVKFVISACTVEELKTGLRPNRKSVDNVLRAKVTLDVREYGVKVVSAFISDLAVPRTVCILSNHSHTI